jgi:hypothetical protein
MKFIKNTAGMLLAVAILATPVAAFSADEKQMDALMEPVKSVLDNYLAIQKELAKDSIKDVDAHANAIAKAVKSDSMKMLSPQVAKQAETLAAAKDLRTAREADKALSASLIKYLTEHKAGRGLYHEPYCPMVKAGWLQTETDIKNPYMGRDMLSCGELKN